MIKRKAKEHDEGLKTLWNIMKRYETDRTSVIKCIVCGDFWWFMLCSSEANICEQDAAENRNQNENGWKKQGQLIAGTIKVKEG